jgi:hypothetical protein
MLWILGTYGNTRRLYIVLQTGLGSNNFRYLRLTWTRSDSGHGTRSERAFTYHCCGIPFVVSTNLQGHEEGRWIERAPYLLKLPDLPGARLRPFNPRIFPSTWDAVWQGVRIQKNQLRVKTHSFEEFGRKESAQPRLRTHKRYITKEPTRARQCRELGSVRQHQPTGSGEHSTINDNEHPHSPL